MDVRDEAFADWKRGMKYKEIAEKYGVSLSAVKTWASRHWKKEAAEKVATKKTKRLQPSGQKSQPQKGGLASSKPKKGAPEGNQNAKGNPGGGAPLRNQNNLKHGAYSKIYWDMLDETEWELLAAIPTGEEFQLKQQIVMYTIRERRMLHQIEEFKENSKKGLYIKSIKKRKRVVSDGDNEKNEAYEDISTDTENTLKSLTTLESELTKIQRAKTKCLDSLIHLKAVNERNDDLLNGWDSKRAAVEKESEDDKEDVVIYLPDNGRE